METKLTTVFGWWDWDGESPALVNRVTGERLAFRGGFADPELVPSDESWLRFDYLHEELTFPLLVQERVVPEPAHKWDRLISQSCVGKTIWRIDYCQSDELWKRESGGRTLEASYGAWRRVDDCVSDAFAFWPEEYSAQGAFARDICLTGGWLNGGWSAEMVRFARRSRNKWGTGLYGYEQDPWLIPMDEAPPSPFVFHDHIPRRNDDGSENWEVENPVLLDGLSYNDPKYKYSSKHKHGLGLPLGTPLTGLEGRTAYLLAVDGTRLLYPIYGDTEDDKLGGHFPRPKTHLLYADEIVVAGPFLEPSRGENFLTNFRMNVRQERPGSPFLMKEIPMGESRYFVPSRPLWLRAQWGVLDGWSRWPGTKAHSPAWLRRSVGLSHNSVTVSGGYLGGIESRDATKILTTSPTFVDRRRGIG